jgi:hypothetical protein
MWSIAGRHERHSQKGRVHIFGGGNAMQALRLGMVLRSWNVGAVHSVRIQALCLTSLSFDRAAETLASCSAGLVELYLQRRGGGRQGPHVTHSAHDTSTLVQRHLRKKGCCLQVVAARAQCCNAFHDMLASTTDAVPPTQARQGLPSLHTILGSSHLQCTHVDLHV